MPALREALSGAGYSAVSTYLQSGNVVLCSDRAPTELEQDCERLIAERFGLEVPVLARTASELAEIVSADPLGELAADPRRYQVTFLAEPLPAERVGELAALAAGQERLGEGPLGRTCGPRALSGAGRQGRRARIAPPPSAT